MAQLIKRGFDILFVLHPPPPPFTHNHMLLLVVQWNLAKSNFILQDDNISQMPLKPSTLNVKKYLNKPCSDYKRLHYKTWTFWARHQNLFTCSTQGRITSDRPLQYWDGPLETCPMSFRGLDIQAVVGLHPRNNSVHNENEK